MTNKELIDFLENKMSMSHIYQPLLIKSLIDAGGLTPQEAIKRGLPKPSECDLVIVILWSRMGTPLPAEHIRPGGTT